MALPRDNRIPTNVVLDELFARVNAIRTTAPPSTGLPPLQAARAETDTIREKAPVPGAGSEVDQLWYNEEKESLEEFTRRQFHAFRQQQQQLEKQREELLRRQTELNEACLVKQQELNRQARMLAGRLQALENRELQLTENENRLILEQQQLLRAREDLQHFRVAAASEEQEVVELRAEIERLMQAEHDSRRQRLEEESALRQGWQTLRAERAELEEQGEVLAQKALALEQMREELESLTSVLHEHMGREGLGDLLREIRMLHADRRGLHAQVRRLQSTRDTLNEEIAQAEQRLLELRHEQAEAEKLHKPVAPEMPTEPVTHSQETQWSGPRRELLAGLSRGARSTAS